MSGLPYNLGDGAGIPPSRETASELIERLVLLLEDIAEHGLHRKPGEDMDTAEKRLKARARNTLAFHRTRSG